MKVYNTKWFKYIKIEFIYYNFNIFEIVLDTILLEKPIEYIFSYNFICKERLIQILPKYFIYNNKINSNKINKWYIKDKKLIIYDISNLTKYNKGDIIQEYIDTYTIYSNIKIDFQFYMLILYYKKKIHIYYYNDAIIRKLNKNNIIINDICIKNLDNYYEILFYSQYILTLLSTKIVDYIKPIEKKNVILQYHLISPIILLSNKMKPYLINIFTKPDYINNIDNKYTIKLKKNLKQELIQLYLNIINKRNLFYNIENMICII